MRKNSLMIAAAVAALSAGSTMAFAQTAPERHGGPAAGPSGAAQVNPASKNAPAEKMAPAVNAEQKNAPANRMGQDMDRNKTKSETTGQAPTERKANEAAPKASESAPKASESAPKNSEMAPKNNAAKPNDRDRAAGQGANEKRDSAQGATEKRDSAQGAPDKRDSDRAGGAATNNRAGASASVNLAPEQRTKIRSVIVADRSAPRVDHVDFDLNVGVAVPRTVRLAAIPSTIVEIEPRWRGFEYFLVGDEIVVVDPASLQIVAVIPA
jgi:hypothetical protein